MVSGLSFPISAHPHDLVVTLFYWEGRSIQYSCLFRGRQESGA